MVEKDSSLYRITQAEQCLRGAKALLEIGDYNGVANRAYYCVLHSMRSLLALDGVACKSHVGVIADFRKKYVKTGIIDREMSRIITDLHDGRMNSDYEDFFIVEKRKPSGKSKKPDTSMSG